MCLGKCFASKHMIYSVVLLFQYYIMFSMGIDARSALTRFFTAQGLKCLPVDTKIVSFFSWIASYICKFWKCVSKKNSIGNFGVLCSPHPRSSNFSIPKHRFQLEKRAAELYKITTMQHSVKVAIFRHKIYFLHRRGAVFFLQTTLPPPPLSAPQLSLPASFPPLF